MLEKTEHKNDVLKLLDTEQMKTAVLVLPLAGTLAAATFDVGYFNGVDVNYFPVFSLSEHVGFTLLVLPFAFLCTFLAWIFFLLLSDASLFLSDASDKSKMFPKISLRNRKIMTSALIFVLGAVFLIIGLRDGTSVFIFDASTQIILIAAVWSSSGR